MHGTEALSLLGIPALDHRAFRPSAGRMRLYGKSDAPPAPDYIGQANATAAGNLNAARAQTAANRVNQVTPYGSIKYTQGSAFDEAGYNAALQHYRDQVAAIDANPNAGALRQYMTASGNTLKAPDRNDFITNPDQWSSEIELSDTGRQLLDQYNRTSLGMGALQDQAMGRVSSALANPFDTSGIPDQVYSVPGGTGMDAWDKASNLIMSRLNPGLDAQQAALDAKLANQGLTAGSEGWQIGQRQFGQQRNDANTSAQLAGAQVQNQMFNQALMGANLSNSGRSQELQTRATLRNLPLQELNALRTGAQVTNPTFSTPGNQGQTSGPDLLGATNQQYNAQVGNVNAQNQQAANTTGAVVGAIGTALSFY